MAGAQPWRIRDGGLEVPVRVTPRGGRDAVDGVGALPDGRMGVRLRVRAAPEDGAATDAARRVLADALGRPASAVTLMSGATARIKLFAVAGDPAGPAKRPALLAGEDAA